jgi:quercetin dioxygenase-like cupin family protein
MKLFAMRDFFKEDYQEYIIGTKETGKPTVYLVYGEVTKGDSRPVAPNGHDEILLLLQGEGTLTGAGTATALKKGQAVSLDPEERFTLRALSDCTYVIAGAHTGSHGH